MVCVRAEECFRKKIKKRKEKKRKEKKRKSIFSCERVVYIYRYILGTHSP